MEEKTKNLLQGVNIDVESAIERFMGNEMLYMKYIKRFKEDENYEKLCQAFAEEDCESAFVAAHTLKGVCGNLSIKELENLLQNQVELLRNGNIKEAQKMMGNIQNSYSRIITVLKELE